MYASLVALYESPMFVDFVNATTAPSLLHSLNKSSSLTATRWVFVCTSNHPILPIPKSVSKLLLKLRLLRRVHRIVST